MRQGHCENRAEIVHRAHGQLVLSNTGDSPLTQVTVNIIIDDAHPSTLYILALMPLIFFSVWSVCSVCRAEQITTITAALAHQNLLKFEPNRVTQRE